MSTIARQLEAKYPDSNRGWDIVVLPIRGILAAQAGRPLWVLFSAVGFVLLLAIANVAGLLLAHTSSRIREFAIRISVGATRLRITRHVLTEAVLLAVVSGVLGLVFAYWLMNALRAAAPQEFALDTTLRLSPTVILFTFAVCISTGLAVGLGPAWYGARAEPIPALAMGKGGASHGRMQNRVLAYLAVAEIALTLVLLLQAGLLLKNLLGILRLDPGVRVDHVLTVILNPPDRKYSSPQQTAQFYDELLTRLRAAVGIRGAGAVATLPMTEGYSGGPFEIEGHVKPADWMDLLVQYNIASPGYFRVMGISVKLGRDFTELDRMGAPPVAIVNDILVRRFFDSVDPIGQSIKFDGPWRTIIGVVGSFKNQNPTQDPIPMIYVPHAQSAQHFMTVTVSYTGNATQAVGTIR